MEKKEVTCECGYSWKTKSRMKFVCCPKCMNKVNINGTGRNNKTGDRPKIHNA